MRGEILDAIREDSSRGEEASGSVMITKYYERIGDHATNIAEWVEYAITGERSEENLEDGIDCLYFKISKNRCFSS